MEEAGGSPTSPFAQTAAQPVAISDDVDLSMSMEETDEDDQHVSVTPNQLQEVEMGDALCSATSPFAQSVAQPDAMLDDVDFSMSTEEIDDDDLLDDDEEFEKDMAMQRLEDFKNGHVLEEVRRSPELPKPSSLPSRLPEEEVDDKFHSLAEIQEMKEKLCARFEEARENDSSQHHLPHLSLRPTGRAAGIRQKVAVFESIITTSPTAVTTHPSPQGNSLKPTKSPSAAAAAAPRTSHLQNAKKKGKKGSGGSQGGKQLVLLPSFAGKGHPHSLPHAAIAFHEAGCLKDAANNPPFTTKNPKNPTAPINSAAILAAKEGNGDMVHHSSHANSLHTTIKDLLVADNTMDQPRINPTCQLFTSAAGPGQEASHLGHPSLGQVHSSLPFHFTQMTIKPIHPAHSSANHLPSPAQTHSRSSSSSHSRHPS